MTNPTWEEQFSDKWDYEWFQGYDSEDYVEIQEYVKDDKSKVKSFINKTILEEREKERERIDQAIKEWCETGWKYGWFNHDSNNREDNGWFDETEVEASIQSYIDKQNLSPKEKKEGKV